MNLLLLLVASQAWRTTSPLARLMRVFAAISVLSLEMQIVTLVGMGSLRTLPALNLVIAIVALTVWRPAPSPDRRREARGAWFIAAALLLGVLVLALNLGMRLEAADAYHLEKVERIERTGTLAYDADAESKINILGSVYELLLADVRQIPGLGPLALRLHGVWNLLLWLMALGAVRQLLPDGGVAPGAGDPAPLLTSRWPWIALLVVPALFHQLVLIKNDLFIAVPSVAVLAWAVTRAGTARPRDIALVLWLAGFAVAVKLTTLPLLLVVGGLMLVRYPDWKALSAAAAGTLIGVVTGGLVFTLATNVQFYGQLMPAGDQGNLNAGAAAALTSLGRFAISLVDLGLGTRFWWPGRGSWGGTFGLPFIWACALLIWTSGRLPLARITLLCAGAYFLPLAAVFPDADLSHRLALAPAMLVIGVAVRVVERGDQFRAWRIALVPVILLSIAQLARSASQYFVR